MLNIEVPKGSPFYGTSHPGTFVVDRNDFIHSKFFEEAHAEQQTFRSILTRIFGDAYTEQGSVTPAPHLKVKTYASQDTTFLGNRLSLSVG